MIRTPKPFEIVVVTWEDARTDAGAQFDSTSAAIGAYKPCVRKSAGFWVGWATKDLRRVALLATDDDRSDESPEAVGGISQIPRGMILAIEPVIPTPKKRKR